MNKDLVILRISVSNDSTAVDYMVRRVCGVCMGECSEIIVDVRGYEG